MPRPASEGAIKPSQTALPDCNIGSRRRLCCAVVFLGVVSATPFVQAAEYDYGIGFSLAHDDNITRVPNDPRSEWTRTLMGRIGFQENSVDLQARIAVQVEHRNFVNNAYPDDTAVYANGLVLWNIVPREFTWILENVARKLRVSLTTPDTPANNAQTNSLNTGPEYTLRFNSTDSFVVGAGYGRFDIAGPGDSQRYSAYGGWLHRLSTPTTFSLNIQGRHTDFDQPSLFTTSNRVDLFARYDVSSTPTIATLDLGVTSINPNPGDGVQGPLIRFSVQRQATSDSVVRLYLSDQILDTYTDLIQSVTGPTGSTVQGSVAFTNPATPDLYHSQRADVTYEVTPGGRIWYTLQGYAGRIDYEHLIQDYNERGLKFTWTWFFAGSTRFRAYADTVRRTFTNFYEVDTERNTLLDLTYLLSNNTNVTLEYGRFSRDSTNASTSFVDNRVLVLLSYTSGTIGLVQSRQ